MKKKQPTAAPSNSNLSDNNTPAAEVFKMPSHKSKETALDRITPKARKSTSGRLDTGKLTNSALLNSSIIMTRTRRASSSTNSSYKSSLERLDLEIETINNNNNNISKSSQLSRSHKSSSTLLASSNNDLSRLTDSTEESNSLLILRGKQLTLRKNRHKFEAHDEASNTSIMSSSSSIASSSSTCLTSASAISAVYTNLQSFRHKQKQYEMQQLLATVADAAVSNIKPPIDLMLTVDKKSVTTTTEPVKIVVPSWRVIPIKMGYRLEGTENTTDDFYVKKHQKYENEEIRIKRLDMRRQREEHLKERLLKGRSSILDSNAGGKNSSGGCGDRRKLVSDVGKPVLEDGKIYIRKATQDLLDDVDFIEIVTELKLRNAIDPTHEVEEAAAIDEANKLQKTQKVQSTAPSCKGEGVTRSRSTTRTAKKPTMERSNDPSFSSLKTAADNDLESIHQQKTKASQTKSRDNVILRTLNSNQTKQMNTPSKMTKKPATKNMTRKENSDTKRLILLNSTWPGDLDRVRNQQRANAKNIHNTTPLTQSVGKKFRLSPSKSNHQQQQQQNSPNFKFSNVNSSKPSAKSSTANRNLNATAPLQPSSSSVYEDLDLDYSTGSGTVFNSNNSLNSSQTGLTSINAAALCLSAAKSIKRKISATLTKIGNGYGKSANNSSFFDTSLNPNSPVRKRARF